MATNIPSIILNMKNPYSAKTHRECVPMWKKVYPTFKDIEHRPPFELAYACYLNLINHIKKSCLCTNCHKPIEGNGLYFPLEDHHIMPLPCCEKCCTFDTKKGDTKSRETRSFIYVNKYQRSIKFYTWKMMVCANLVVHMYNKMIKEEIDKKEEESKKNVSKWTQETKENIQETVREEINIIEEPNVNIVQNQEIVENYEFKKLDAFKKLETNNYYFGNIEEDNNTLYKNMLYQNIYDEVDKKKVKENQNMFMIFISFIATILFSSLYLILNK
jgi:hypothetical protein